MDNKLMCIFCQVATFHSADELLTHLRIHTGDIAEVDLVSTDSEETRSIVNTDNEQEGGPLGSISSERTESTCGSWENEGTTESPSLSFDGVEVDNRSDSRTAATSGPRSAPVTLQRAKRQLLQQFDDSERKAPPLESYPPCYQRMPRIVAVQGAASMANNAGYDGVTWTAPCGISSTSQVPERSIHPDEPHNRHPDDEPQQPPALQLGKGTHPDTPQLNSSATREFGQSAMETTNNPTAPIADLTPWARHQHLSSAPYLSTYPQAYGIPHVQQAQLIRASYNQTIPLQAGTICSTREGNVYPSSVAPGVGSSKAHAASYYDNIPSMPLEPFPRPGFEPYHTMEPVSQANPLLKSQNVGIDHPAPPFVHFADMSHSYVTQVTPSVATSMSPFVTNLPPSYFLPLPPYIAHTTTNVSQPSVIGVSPTNVIGNVPTVVISESPPAAVDDVSPTIIGGGIGYPFIPSLYPGMSSVLQSTQVTSGLSPRLPDMPPKPDVTDELSPRVTNVPSSSIPAYEFPSGKVIPSGSPLRGKKRILSPPPKHVMLSPNRGECKTSSKPRALKVVKTFQIKELGLHTLQPNTNQSPVYKVSRSPPPPAAITSSKSPQLIKRAHTMPFATTRGKLSEDKSPVEMFKEAAFAEDLTESAAIQSTVLGSTESSQSSHLIKRACTLPLTTTGGPPSQGKFVEVPKEGTSSKDLTQSLTRQSTSQGSSESSKPPKEVVSSGSHGKKAIWIKLPEGSTWVPPTKDSFRPSYVKAGTQPFKFTTRINSTCGDNKKIVDVPVRSSSHLSSAEPGKVTGKKLSPPIKKLSHSSTTEVAGSVATSKQRIISCSISEGCKIRKRVKLPSKDLSHAELAATGVVKSRCSNCVACDGSCPLCQPQTYPTKIALKAQPSDDPNNNTGYDTASSEHEQHVATSTTKSFPPGHFSIPVDSSTKTTSNASMSGDDEKTISSTIEDQDLQSIPNNPDGSAVCDDGSSSGDNGYIIISETLPKPSQSSQSSEDDVLIVPTPTKLTKAMKSNFALSTVKSEPLSDNEKALDDKTKPKTKHVSCLKGGGDFETSSSSVQEFGIRTLARVSDSCIDLKLKIEVVNGKGRLMGEPGDGDKQCSATIRSKVIASRVKPIRFRCPKCQSGFQRITDQMKHRCKGRKKEKSLDLSTAFARLKMFKCLDCLEKFATIEEKMQHPCTQRKPEVRESSDDDKSPSKKRKKKRGRPRKEEAVDPMMAQEYHYPCNHCGKWFLKEAHLRCHTAFCPQNEAKPKWEHTVPGAPVWCISCGRMFVRKRFLDMHLMWNNNCKAMYDAQGLGYSSNQPTGAVPKYPDIDIKKEPKDVDNGEVHSKMEIDVKDQCNKLRKLTDADNVNKGNAPHSLSKPPSSKTPLTDACSESDGDPDCDNARPGGSQCPFCKDDSRIFPSLQALSMHTMYAHNKTVYRRRSGCYFGDASPTEGKHRSNYGTIPTTTATDKRGVNLWTCLLCTDISYVFISKESYVAHYKAKHGITAVGESLISDKVVSVRSAAPTPDGDVPSAPVELDVLDLTEGRWDTGELSERKVDEVTMDVHKGNEFKPEKELKEQEESTKAASISSKDTSALTQSCEPSGSDKSKKKSTTTDDEGSSVALLEQEKPKAINVNIVQSSVVKKWISGSLNRKNDVQSSSAYHGQQLSNWDVVNSLEAKTEHSKKEASAKSSVHSSSSTELGQPKAAGVDVIHSSQTDLYHCCRCSFTTPLYSATQRHLMISHNIRRPNISQPGSDESSIVKMSTETHCQSGRSAMPTKQGNTSSERGSAAELAPMEQGKTSSFRSSTERSSVAEYAPMDQGTTSSSTSSTDRSSVAEFQYRKLISAQRTVSPTFQKTTTGYVCLVCKAEVPNGGRKYHAKKNRHVEYKCGVCSLTFVGKRNVIKHVKATHGDVICRMKESNTLERGETVMPPKPTEPESTIHVSTARTVSSDSDVKGKNRFLRELGMQIVADNISKTTTKCESATLRVSNSATDLSENVASGQHKEVNIAAKIPVQSAQGKPEENKTDDVDQVQSDTNTSNRMSDSDQATQNCDNSESSLPDISTSKNLDASRPVVEGQDYTREASGIVLDESFAYIEVGPKKLECPLCKKVVKPYLRKRHMVSHTNKDGYHCSHCSYKTTHQHNVMQHVHLQHRDKAWIKNLYVIDQEIIREGRKLAREKTVDQGTGFATCSYCSVFISKQALAIHMLQHMEKNPYKCKLCEYSCKQPISIQLHAKNHHAPWASKKTRCDKKTGDDASGRSKRRADQKKNPGKTTATGKRACTAMDVTHKKTASEGPEILADAKTEKSEVQGGEGTSQKLLKQRDCHTKNSLDNGGPKDGAGIFDFTDSDGDKSDGAKESGMREKQWKVKQFYKEIKESRPTGNNGMRKMQDPIGKNSLCDSEHLTTKQLPNTSERDHDSKTAPRTSNLTKSILVGQERDDNGSRTDKQKTLIKQTPGKLANTDVLTGTKKCAANDAAKGTRKETTESQGWRSRAWKINSGDPNPYQCNYCNFQTSKVSSVRTHMVVKHNKQRSWIKRAYTCDEKALKESVDLAMEQPCDASSKQYTCTFCKRICIGKNGMAVHILQHTGANPFQCNLCSYQCKQIVSIELHVKKMHVGAVVKSSTVGGVGNRVTEHIEKNVESATTATSEQNTEKKLMRKTLDGDENSHGRKDHSVGSKHLSMSRIGEKCKKDETSRESSGRTGISSTGECHAKSKDASKNISACVKTKSEKQKHDLPLPSKSTDGIWKFAAERRVSDSGRESTTPMRVPKKRKLEQMETENTLKKQKVHRDQGIDESIAIAENEKEQQQCTAGKAQPETVVEAKVGTSKQNSSHLEERQDQNVSQKPHATDNLSTRVIQYLQKKKRQVILECGKEQSQKQTVSLECDDANSSEVMENSSETQSGNHTVSVHGSSNELEKPHHADKPCTSKSSMDISAPQSVKRVLTQPSLTYDPRKKQKVSQIMVENPRKTVNDVRMAKASFSKMDYLSVLKQRYLHRERDLGAKVWSEEETDEARKQTTSECTTSYGTEKCSGESNENIKDPPMEKSSSQQAKRARTSPHQEFKGMLKQKTPKKGFIKKEDGVTQDDTGSADTEMGTLFKTSHLYDLTEMYYFNKLTQKYLCKECDMDFKSPRKAATHCEDHSDLCMYMCKCCSYSSRYLECINGHIQLCHQAQLKSVQSSSKTDMVHEQTVNIASSQAEDCLLMMKTLRDKKQRPRRDIDSGNFVCQFCGYMSSSYHKVEEHTRKHTGEKVYHCLVCVEKGSRHSEMVKHVELCHLKHQDQTKTIGHEGDKPVSGGSVRKHTGHDARHKKVHGDDHKGTVLNRSTWDTKIGERTPQSVDRSNKWATDDMITSSTVDEDANEIGERNVWKMFDSP